MHTTEEENVTSQSLLLAKVSIKFAALPWTSGLISMFVMPSWFRTLTIVFRA